MPRCVTIHQPHYWPWLGLIDKIDCADVFCILDTVDFEKGGYQNRTRIAAGGAPQWLTIPVVHHLGQRIMDVQIADSAWPERHWRTLQTAYGNAPYFEKYQAFFQAYYQKMTPSPVTLVGALTPLIALLQELCAVRTPVIFASCLKVAVGVTQTARLVAICKALRATEYLSGSGGRAYLDLDLFREAGIAVRFQTFTHPTYAQQRGEFLPNLSVVDALFRIGGAKTLSLLRGQREKDSNTPNGA